MQSPRVTKAVDVIRLAAVIAAALLSGQGCGAEEAPIAETTACSTAVASAPQFNGSQLFDGSASCAQEKREGDTNYLIILGQLRAMADMLILTPLDEANAAKAARLYGRVYYQFGGLGFEEFYRSAENVRALEQRIRATVLSFVEGYDPGWAFKPSSKTDIYDAVLSNAREQRLWQMRTVAVKLQDEEYWRVSLALTELQRQNPVLKQGTPAYEEHARLSAQLDEIAKRIPEEPPPPDTTPYARLNEPDPDLAAQQVAMGFNGPAKEGPAILRSEAELRNSWLAAALPEAELAGLIARTNFAAQSLVVLSVGRRINASGTITLSELRAAPDGYDIGVRIGVVPESCGIAFGDSYPFVVAIAEAMPGASVTGMSMSNFPAECGPVVSGQPTPQ